MPLTTTHRTKREVKDHTHQEDTSLRVNKTEHQPNSNRSIAVRQRIVHMYKYNAALAPRCRPPDARQASTRITEAYVTVLKIRPVHLAQTLVGIGTGRGLI